MGAPKQKWTAEEEAALKAGVLKHGAGKWRTILTDPEFSGILHLRSNVDLKDKWRNINVTAIWGSRQKAKLALKRDLPTPKLDDNPISLSIVPQSDAEIVDAKPLVLSRGTLQTADSKEPFARLDKLILEAITNLKEPRGSDRAAIALYIEIKHKYRIASSSTFSEKRRSSSLLVVEDRQKDSSRAEKREINILTKTQVDAELSKMKGMTAQEAAAAAAQAVAEAEAAIAEAEKAAREAEAAEAEAEAAQVFAKAAMKALKCGTLRA
ncbi:telomere repeat-binding factor 2 isoform X2 [Castanea sativa]|uniref:telomere repeat-binding factor 2 isoform X2 n=1 Tax=Castanea sativa TaxID=21020 RepID=UPI003F64F8C6